MEEVIERDRKRPPSWQTEEIFAIVFPLPENTTTPGSLRQHILTRVVVLCPHPCRTPAVMRP